MHLDSRAFSGDLISAWGIAIILITVTESLRCTLAGVEPKEKASLWTIRKAEAYSALTMEFLTFAKLGIAVCIIFLKLWSRFFVGCPRGSSPRFSLVSWAQS